MASQRLMPIFSIIVPTYNRADRIARTINSVLCQTFPDFELLIIDDGSTDNTREVVATYSDRRIRYFLQSNSGGPASPRNKGIGISSGELIAFLDADDEFTPDKLEVVYKTSLRMPGADVYAHNIIKVDDNLNSESLMLCGPFESGFYKALLCSGNRLSNSGTVVRREFILKNNLWFDTDSRITSVEDFDFWLRIALLDGRFQFLNHALSRYHVDGTGISCNEQRFHEARTYCIRKHVFELQEFEPNFSRLYADLKALIDIQLAWGRSPGDNITTWMAGLLMAAIARPVLTCSLLIGRARLYLVRRWFLS